MKQFWLTVFGSMIGVLAGAVLLTVFMLFLIGGLIGSALQSAQSDPQTIPFNRVAVLELDLRLPRTDQPERSPFALSNPLSMVELHAALDRAAQDDQVAGVFVRANTQSLPPAQAEEIARLFDRFSGSGKFVLAHAQGFEGSAITAYQAVAGVEELWLQDTSSFSAVGLSTETLFLGGFFEQFGATPQFIQLHEYKNAADVYTQASYTEAHREATLSWLGALFDSALEGLAPRRAMEGNVDALRTRLVNGPYSAETALQTGLVDRLGHVAQARQAALERAGDTAVLVDIATYNRSPRPAAAPRLPVIALISGQGPIVTGASDTGFGGGPMIGGDSLADAIDAAAQDAQVRAIILRIDSPGGSAIASDQIWDAVIRARQAGKPVIASMGGLAASGGYYIAAPADLIVANASTLTGSIGMLGGKVVIDGALERVGLNLEPLAVGGEYTLAFSAATPWSDTQAAAYGRLAQDVYSDFTQRVAEGRDLPLARVEEIARGRVWTGQQALELGLVDRLGGLDTAIAAARELAGLSEREAISLRAYPAPLTPLEALQALFGVSGDSLQTAAELNALLQDPQVQAVLTQIQAQRATELTAPVTPPH